MLFQPGARLQAIMTGEIIGNEEDVPARIVRLDSSEQLNVAFGIARGRATGDFLAIAYPERSIDPGFFRPPTILERRFDAMAIGRPTRGWLKGAWDYRSEFVSTDGRRACGRVRVLADDRGPFGMKSLSRGSLQLCVLRHRTPSRKRMRRT